MTIFKKTILGKILGKVAKVALPIVGAITGIGAISGAAKGIGVLAGVTGAYSGIAKSVSAVAVKAVDLVTGTTKVQRDAVKDQKAETQAEKDKVAFADKLMKAGASKAEAYATAGISETSQGLVSTSNMKPLLIGGGMLVGGFILAKLLKIIK